MPIKSIAWADTDTRVGTQFVLNDGSIPFPKKIVAQVYIYLYLRITLYVLTFSSMLWPLPVVVQCTGVVLYSNQ